MLVEAGEVDLDDPIQDHLPGVVSTEVIDTFNRDNRTFTSRPPARAVTIRDLLTNSSGIGYWFSNDTLFALIGGGRATTSLDYPLLHDPGARWTYGQSTRVLGMLVEQLSGRFARKPGTKAGAHSTTAPQELTSSRQSPK